MIATTPAAVMAPMILDLRILILLQIARFGYL
jgi:hypothetical protein